VLQLPLLTAVLRERVNQECHRILRAGIGQKARRDPIHLQASGKRQALTPFIHIHP
jgi:hypothetical protein